MGKVPRIKTTNEDIDEYKNLIFSGKTYNDKFYLYPCYGNERKEIKDLVVKMIKKHRAEMYIGRKWYIKQLVANSKYSYFLVVNMESGQGYSVWATKLNYHYGVGWEVWKFKEMKGE